jgi:hypothetical protein
MKGLGLQSCITETSGIAVQLSVFDIDTKVNKARTLFGIAFSMTLNVDLMRYRHVSQCDGAVQYETCTSPLRLNHI